MKALKFLSVLFVAVLVSTVTVSCDDDDDNSSITEGGIKKTMMSRPLWKAELDDGTVECYRFTSSEAVRYHFPEIEGTESPYFRIIDNWSLLVEKGVAKLLDDGGDLVAQFRANDQDGIDYFDSVSSKWVLMEPIDDMTELMDIYGDFI